MFNSMQQVNIRDYESLEGFLIKGVLDLETDMIFY